ncbi:MAG TPA: TAT-variant-translocated molybdopterin oxidoreductase, partial [Gemmataceae bacterium]|nr:TAT-variant-translocated molybdopterin oxidoreductase [Gemmataceae bacterium]
MPSQDEPLDLTRARQRLAAARGKDYWRGLEELAETDGFEEMLEKEFPRQAGGWMEGVNRRQFLKLMGASLALAGLSGCGASRPTEQILPYVRQPEEIIPGRPLYFATAMPLAGYGSGLLVESHLGRPTKVEGNPLHPTGHLPTDSPEAAAHGPTDAFAQASVLGLYDPDRSQAVTHLGSISSWDTFTTELAARLRGRRENGIDPDLRIRILTETVTSPSLAHQIQAVLRRFPQAKWHVYEPAGSDNARVGARHAFGRDVAVHYRFDRANVILSLDADFLSCGPGHLRYVRDFSSRRQVRQPRQDEPPPRPMSRLYVVESTLTPTGAKADHRRALRAEQVESFARAVAVELRVAGVEPAPPLPDNIIPAGWIPALVRDLRANGQTSIILAGDGQPPIVHALAFAMNEALGNLGS